MSDRSHFIDHFFILPEANNCCNHFYLHITDVHAYMNINTTGRASASKNKTACTKNAEAQVLICFNEVNASGLL